MLLTPHSSFQAIPGSLQTHQLRSERRRVQQGKVAELAEWLLALQVVTKVMTVNKTVLYRTVVA